MAVPPVLEGRMIPPPAATAPPYELVYESYDSSSEEGDQVVTRRYYEPRSLVWNAIGMVNGACSFLYQNIDDFINSVSRPRWVERPGWKPYAQKSMDIGHYEYEVMIYRRPLGICEKLQECTVRNLGTGPKPTPIGPKVMSVRAPQRVPHQQQQRGGPRVQQVTTQLAL
eukprot:Protomagalhaensia_wolfi_Nauph_80__1321@NODE_178_length_3281_cov_479_197717_g134_i0_p2_GENE_NODE_178_length_3281_cov_479_197717_g134_i0NODE_178_length_3281_cov_479_197717_g134_i0_p2_ORF_typecomplete_len169_score15_09_NODE_178_length_3281_cov_479_197717_g134_i023672873